MTAHAPPVHVSPGQQLLLELQDNPVPRQVGGLTHAPLVQVRPEQHGAVASQPWPELRQLAGTPSEWPEK